MAWAALMNPAAKAQAISPEMWPTTALNYMPAAERSLTSTIRTAQHNGREKLASVHDG